VNPPFHDLTSIMNLVGRVGKIGKKQQTGSAQPERRGSTNINQHQATLSAHQYADGAPRSLPFPFAVSLWDLYLTETVNEVTMLRDDINNALKGAMKAKNERRVSTLRLVNSALKNADIEARGQGKGPLGDDAVLGLLQKMIKQRQESVELYEKGGRAELAQQEREEIAIITAYLPKQMSEDEVGAAISQAVQEVGAAGMKDMGKVVGALKAKYAGKMDFAKASALVKAALSG
jgi:uncharacterized protein